ncbi:MAG: glycosyltransferase family 2 protein [Candidatus Rokubacteria bacterium]|nr:glycosyltransferase family 2 protein [Candidatus Rokubacteria bacterium]
MGAAVASVLAQTAPDLELIVVDDGSTDGTPATLAAVRDPRLVVVRQAREGLTRALNRALRLARAPLLARLDADDLALPEGARGRARRAAGGRRGDPPRADPRQPLRPLVGDAAPERARRRRRVRRAPGRRPGLRSVDAPEPGHPARQPGGAARRPPPPAWARLARARRRPARRRGPRALARGGRRRVPVVVRRVRAAARARPRAARTAPPRGAPC